MVAGGALAACALIAAALGLPWYGLVPVFGALGFGFYLLHGCIHVHVTELSATARSAATALHSCMFYLGQASGPVFYGFTFAHDAEVTSVVGGALVVLGVSLTCAKLLRHRAASH